MTESGAVSLHDLANFQVEYEMWCGKVSTDGVVTVLTPNGDVVLELSQRFYDRMIAPYLAKPGFVDGFDVVIERSGANPVVSKYMVYPVKDTTNVLPRKLEEGNG